MEKRSFFKNFLLRLFAALIVISLCGVSSADVSFSDLNEEIQVVRLENEIIEENLEEFPNSDASFMDVIIFKEYSNLFQSNKQLLFSDAQLVESYKSFCHLKLNDEQIIELKNKGYVIQRLQDLGSIRIGSNVFKTSDFTKGLSKLFPPQWITATTSLDPLIEEYYIVQFKGPIKNEWLSELEDRGAILLQTPIDYYSHLIKIIPTKEEEIRSLDFIIWMDFYHPALRLRGGLEHNHNELLHSSDSVNVEIIFFKEISEQVFLDRLLAIEKLSGRINQIELNNPWWFSAKISLQKSKLDETASLPGVNYIIPYYERELRNDNARWVIQSFNATSKAAPVWDAGLNGTGIVVGMADTGIDYDHIFFRHNATSAGTPGLNHRKIIRYNTSWDDWDYEGNVDSGHGTHTSGSIVGDSLTSPNAYDTNDGMAYGAKMAFYDVVKAQNSWDPQYITVYFDDAYEVGARSHSDSWGDDTRAYTARSERCDQYQWDHYDFLIFIAPGNTGAILEPATAKNVIGVGNAANGNTKSLVGGSGKGPTLEGMISPTIIAPGGVITSAASDGSKASFNSGLRGMSGTSMSTPIAAGGTALVEQYFREGFYPGGKKNAEDGFMPSGPLKKAVCINSGEDMYGGSNINGHIPDNSQGWGKMVLDNTLYFEGETKGLWIEDRYNLTSGKPGLETGDCSEYMFNINSTEPFEITVVWNDYPGAGLKNDLDLIVTGPDNHIYFGNAYKNGKSVTGGIKDSKNPIESVYFKNPVSGYYQIKVYGTNIGSGGSQNYAIVAAGEFNDDGKGQVLLNSSKYGPDSVVGVTVLDSNLAGSGTAKVTFESSVESETESVSLVEDEVLGGRFTGSINLVLNDTAAADGKLQVKTTDTITATYIDSKPWHESKDSASIDMEPPIITEQQVLKIDTDSFVVYWKTNEPATTEVRYGTNNYALGYSLKSEALVTEHTVEVSSLSKEKFYFFNMVSADDVNNIAVDNNNGSHYSIITASYELYPEDFKVGWVGEGENYNHFDDARICAGVINDKIRIGALQFNLTSLPDDLRIFAAYLNLFGNDASQLSASGGNWYVECLNISINTKFNGSKYSPVYFDIMNETAKSRFLPSPVTMTPSSVLENSWQHFELNLSYRLELEELIHQNGTVTFRIKGPSSKTGGDNLFSWDSGFNVANGSRGIMFRPQFVFWAEKAPRVSSMAPSKISFDEDNIESSKINLSNIFISNKVLEFAIESHYEANNTPIPGKNLTIEILPNSSVSFTPKKNWNGVERVIINGSVKSNNHREMDGISDIERKFVVYEFDVAVDPVNDRPVILSIGSIPVYHLMNITVDQNDLFEELLVFEDADLNYEGDSHKFSTNSSLIVFESEDGNKIKFTPVNSDVGFHIVEFLVKDSTGAADGVTVRIIINNTNDVPVPNIAEPSDGSYFNTSWPITFNGTGSGDPDEIYGDYIRYEWLSDKDGYLGAEKIISRYIKSTGEHRITLKVYDSELLFDAIYITINVNKTEGFLDPDIDLDGMPNDWELKYDLDPYDSTDQYGDPDADSLTNFQEYVHDTDPGKKDTDGDGHSDGDEIIKNTDPIDEFDYPGRELEQAKMIMNIIVAIFIVITVVVLIFFFLRLRRVDTELEEEEERERMRNEEERIVKDGEKKVKKEKKNNQ